MKVLHLLKSEPDPTTAALISAMKESGDTQYTTYMLSEAGADYDELIDLIFAHDAVISWW